MTLEEAKKLVILKWTYIVQNNGSYYGLLQNISELKDLNGNCAYCELFMNKGCKGCPICPSEIMDNGSGCRQVDHPFDIWYYNKNRENAQAVLDLIINH
jgi:recombinational DNA repair protein RecR